jgi:hypothetical protein
MKVPLTILTFRRPEYLDQTIGSFLKLNANILDRFSIRVLVQGGDDADTSAVLKKYKSHIDRVEILSENTGVSGGFTKLMTDAVKEKRRYVFHLEDDWVSKKSLSPYIKEVMTFLDLNREVGQVRLRSVLSKVCMKNPFRGIEKVKWQKIGRIKKGPAIFTFNPAITRIEVLRQILPVTSEKEACIKYDNLGLECGQLIANCFEHIGVERAYECRDGKKSYVR